ncbi:MAG: DNA repair protein RadA [Clostridia bacterium]|nr:DNA repair protein RadA [Clostridia bacterium]
MAQKTKSIYICSECGYESPKWNGCCPGCGEWNTMNEEIVDRTAQKTSKPVSTLGAAKITDITYDDEVRINTGIHELNRVLGGGIVIGSLVLLCGDPGIGKSTLLLQICEYIGKSNSILYVSGEESARQIKLRANRLEVNSDNLSIMCGTDINAIINYINTEKPGLVIIDSIQTMSVPEIASAPGSVTQVRESTNLLMQCAKSLNIPVFIVGHVNKDGNIAGPKVLEHIVDCVLYFEGERHLSYRILRAVKNRFGSTNEIGVFEMSSSGLNEVENPSMMLISGKPKDTSGSCVVCIMEGSRPILAEVQGLVVTSGYGNSRRMSNGFDYNRLSMLLAVLEKRDGYYLSNCDAYINVVGGLKLDEPATDLAVALAIISSLKDVPIREDTIAVGEIGLGGEIRAVTYCEQRIAEVERLGFKRIIIPKHNMKSLSVKFKSDIEIIGVNNIKEAFDASV